MKRNLFYLMSLLMMAIISSCSQDDTIGGYNDNSSLANVEMTYEQYLKGYTAEELATPKDEQTPTTTPETVADAKLMKLIKDSLENSYSKTRVSTRASGYYPFYGVFKVNTCGNYPEVSIFMDCEDGGWTTIDNGSLLPGTWVDKNRNIGMTFCVVGNDRTEFIAKYGYGALYFHGGNAHLVAQNAQAVLKSGTVEFLERFHDNDDKNNRNEFKIIRAGNLEYNALTEIYPSAVPRPTYQDKNTLLTWIISKGWPKTPFNPGFSYGLFSTTVGDVTLHIDDENGSNTNYCNIVQWNERYGWVRNTDFNPRVFKDLDLLYNTKYQVKIFQ